LDIIRSSLLQKKLLEAAKVLNSQLIVTEQYPKVLGSTDKDLDISRAALVQPKTLFSMLTPEVESKLNGIESVVLFGIESHVCVLQTCLDLLRKEYDVRVVVDCVSSANRSEIATALKRMSFAGAVLTSSDSLLFELMVDSKHPQFKEISNIVKANLELTKKNPLASNMISPLPSSL